MEIERGVSVAIDAISPHPQNYNAHPAQQIAELRRSLRAFGQVRDIIVWQGYIVAGHGVVTAAREEGWPSIMATRLPGAWDEARVMAYMAADNETARLSETDDAQLAALLQAVGDEELRELAAGGAARLREIIRNATPTVPPEAQVDRAEELREKWGVELGQMWRLGEHRIICGDCTDPAVVARVMGGEKAEMVWTDPPYGVAVGDKNKFLNSIARSNRVEENLENDTLDEPELAMMLCTAFDNGTAVCLAGAAWFVAAPPGPLQVLFGQALKDRGIWRQTIQWVKNAATFVPLGRDYRWRCEPIFYGWVPGAAHRYYGGRKQDTVWEIDRPLKSPEHPTMKPVELVERAINNHSLWGEIVLDLFSGSGTTIIACERLGRKCRAAEIAAKYVAVSIERWAEMTGGTPELME